MNNTCTNLILGTAQFNGPYGISNPAHTLSDETITNILKLAFQSGITTLDTAVDYGNAETIIGANHLTNWKIITKLPSKPAHTTQLADWVSSTVERSLSRLNTEILEGLLFHHPTDLLTSHGEFLYRTVHDLKTHGLLQKIGISCYEPTECENLIRAFDFDIIQAPISIFDQRMINAIKRDPIRFESIEIHARSIFLQGLLLQDIIFQKTRFPRWHRLWGNYHTWLDQIGLTALEACIGFIQAHDCIDKWIVGIDNICQLQEIVAIISQGLSIKVPEDLSIVDPMLLNPTNWLVRDGS